MPDSGICTPVNDSKLGELGAVCLLMMQVLFALIGLWRESFVSMGSFTGNNPL